MYRSLFQKVKVKNLIFQDLELIKIPVLSHASKITLRWQTFRKQMIFYLEQRNFFFKLTLSEFLLQAF